jgi:uncharacterized SAM-binding protein YcdF (DUF218 family)
MRAEMSVPLVIRADDLSVTPLRDAIDDATSRIERRVRRARGHDAVRLAIGVGIVLLVVVAWGARHHALRSLGAVLVHEDTLVPSDVAVVSIASPRGSALDAVKLYRRGLVREVWVSHWRTDPVDRRMAALGVRVPRPDEVARAVLEHGGVPASAIHLLDEPVAGLEAEMAVLGRALRSAAVRRVIVLTARTHTARARVLLRDAFAPGVGVLVRAPHSDQFTPDAWWRDRDAAREVLLEYLKWARLLVSGPSTWA